MRIDRRPRRVLSWRQAAQQASAVVAMIAGCSALLDQVGISVQARAGAAQSTSDDPCRFATADAMGRAFGRQLKSSKLANVCQYRGTGSDVVVVKVAAGPEGTILRHVRSAAAQGHKGAEKATTTVGEAYFDSILPAFIGRVGNYDVQIETTIEPVPRDAMIAVGTRIMETLAGK